MRPTTERSCKFWPYNFTVSTPAPYLHPFEFTDDPLAEDANRFLQETPSFCSDLFHAFQDNSLEGIFGLVLARKVLATGRELVEYTFGSRTSVLKEMLPCEHVRCTLTETSWVFDPDKAAMACKTKCFETTQHQVYHDPKG
jgi:hypothetical protein